MLMMNFSMMDCLWYQAKCINDDDDKDDAVDDDDGAPLFGYSTKLSCPLLILVTCTVWPKGGAGWTSQHSI